MTRTLTIIALCLFCLWLASIAILLCFLAGLAPIPWLVGAIVAQVGVACVGGGVLLVTNTRRPRGIDPDSPRPAILYGRREDDDRGIVERVSALMEEEAAKRPASSKTPDWFISERKGSHDDAAAMFPKEGS